MRSALDLDATLADTHQPGQRVGRDRRRGRKHVMSYLDRLPVLAGARQLAGAHALGRRAQPGAAGAPVRAAGQRAGARRADQRPRHRHARAARGAAAELRRHGVPGQPRPALPRQRRHQHDRLGRRRSRRACWREYEGGYEDWKLQRERARGAARRPSSGARRRRRRAPRRRPRAAPAPRAPKPRKLSYKEQRELDALPARIEALEAEQKDARARCSASAELYAEDPARAEAAQMRYAQIDDELLAALERWEALGAP